MFASYIDHSDQYMWSLFHCMDNAHAAEKMFNWANLGDDNEAWQTGPFISAPANRPTLSHDYPYCMRVSKQCSYLMGYQFGMDPPRSKNGGVFTHMDSQRRKSTEIIPTVSVNVQFSILEGFEFDLFDEFKIRMNFLDSDTNVKRYERRPVESRLISLFALANEPVCKELINAYKSIAIYRNKLTHEPNSICDSPQIAFDVYRICQAIAYKLTLLVQAVASHPRIGHRIDHWCNLLDYFVTERDFDTSVT